MRNTIFGLVFGGILIGLLFWAAGMTSHPTLAQKVAQSAEQIGKGFVGVRMVGAWQVACGPAPMVVGTKPAAPANAASGQNAQNAQTPAAQSTADKTKQPTKPISFGRCRTTLEFSSRNRGRQPMLSVSFRLVGPTKVLTAVVRFPPIARAGQMAALAIRGGVLKIPVNSCSATNCIAVSGLSAASQRALLGSPAGLLVLPPMRNGQRAKLRVPFFGLPPSIDAIRRAES